MTLKLPLATDFREPLEEYETLFSNRCDRNWNDKVISTLPNVSVR